MRTDLTCLTYNLCWGCQTNRKAKAEMDASTQPLSGTLCRAPKNENRTTCKNAIVKVIDSLNDLYGGLHIIALQEIKSLKSLKKNSSTLSRLRQFKWKEGSARVATLVDRRHFSVFGKCGGTDCERGRPFLVLFATLRNDFSTIVILLNVHASHRKSVCTRAISFSCDQYLNKNPDVKRKVSDARKVTCLALGDWNDAGQKKLWRGWLPFQTSHFLHKIKVSTKEKPPRSCCNPSGDDRPMKFYGDYIMASEEWKLKMQSIENSVTLFGLTSDHLPVIAQATLDTARTV